MAGCARSDGAIVKWDHATMAWWNLGFKSPWLHSTRSSFKRIPSLQVLWPLAVTQMMTPAERNFIMFKTDLFVFEQRDEDIDQWFVGGDCAGWFYARLLPVDRIKY